MPEVPERIRFQVKIALDGLGAISRALAAGRSADAQFAGNGRYEYECWWHVHDREKQIAQCLGILELFRTNAKALGIDPEVTINELGGVPDYTPSPAVDRWLESDKAKEVASA